MRKNKILILALLVCLSIPVRAQNTDNNIIGIVVDKSETQSMERPLMWKVAQWRPGLKLIKMVNSRLRSRKDNV